MLDIKKELQGYQPIDIDKLSGDKSTIPDNIRNSIIMYNKAIESLHMNSEDIAIIELKKAIAMNPSFHEAINLLGICYFHIGNYEKAQQLFERVAMSETNGINAYRYIRIISESVGLDIPAQYTGISFPVITTGAEGKDRDSGRTARVSHKGISFKSNGSGKKMNTMRYIAGFLAGIFLCAVFILAGGIEKSTAELTGMGEQLEKLQNDNDALTAQYESLDGEYNLQKGLLESANDELDYYILTGKLFDMYAYYSVKDYEGAAEIILLIKDAEFREPAASFYAQNASVILPLAANAAYEKGRNLQKEGKFADAVTRFLKVELYDAEFDQMPAVYYNMGKCYRDINDTTKAAESFQKIIDNYPDSQYADWAAVRLNELNG